MRIPAEYPKTLYMLQATDTTIYVVAAVVIYIYGGKNGRHSFRSRGEPLTWTDRMTSGIARTQFNQPHHSKDCLWHRDSHGISPVKYIGWYTEANSLERS